MLTNLFSTKYLNKLVLFFLLLFASTANAHEERCKGFIGTKEELIILGIEFDTQFFDDKLTIDQKKELSTFYGDNPALFIDPDVRSRPPAFKDIIVENIKTISGRTNWTNKLVDTKGKQLPIDGKIKDTNLTTHSFSLFNFSANSIGYNMAIVSTNPTPIAEYRYFFGFVTEHKTQRQNQKKYEGQPLFSFGLCAANKKFSELIKDRSTFIEEALKVRIYARLMTMQGSSEILAF